MSEICMDEEYLELVSPILEEFVVPSNIAVHLAPHLGQDDIMEIIKAERQNGTAIATRLMVNRLQTMARAYYENTGQNQDRPIFTALVDILSERGYEVLNRFLRQPEEITSWKEHLRLFEIYLPQLSKINVNEFIIELISADLIDVRTPEHDLVMTTLKHEGNEMAILEILNHIWRKKINWSKRFIGALKNHMESGGVIDEDMIDTMESKTDHRNEDPSPRTHQLFVSGDESTEAMACHNIYSKEPERHQLSFKQEDLNGRIRSALQHGAFSEDCDESNSTYQEIAEDGYETIEYEDITSEASKQNSPGKIKEIFRKIFQKRNKPAGRSVSDIHYTTIPESKSWYPTTLCFIDDHNFGNASMDDGAMLY